MRYLGMRAGMLAGLAVYGCGTEPDRSFKLTVSAPERVAVVPSSPSVGFGFTCEFTITARASGGGAGDYAEWQGAEIHVDDGLIFRPLWTMSAPEVAAFFGADRISAGGVQTANVSILSPRDLFPVTHEFRYRLASGEVETASVTTLCD